MSTPEMKEVDAKTAREWLAAGTAVLVDVREADEHARERIDEAISAPLSSFNGAALSGDRAKTVIFHCARGNRTWEKRDVLLGSRFAESYHLVGGITAWREAGLPTTINRAAPLPIQRQVQLGAGSLALLGVVLGFLVSPWWFGLSAFVGCGLMMAGATGWCGMALLLERMPWNRHGGAGNDPMAATTGS